MCGVVDTGLMVRALNSRLSGPHSRPAQGHCVLFLSQTLYSHSASLQTGVQIATGKFNAGWTSIPSRREYAMENKITSSPMGHLVHMQTLPLTNIYITGKVTQQNSFSFFSPF